MTFREGAPHVADDMITGRGSSSVHIPTYRDRRAIGLITYGVGDPNNYAVWAGVADVARERDVNLFCFPGKPLRSPIGFDAQANILYDLIDKENFDGLVIWGGAMAHHVDVREVQAFCERYRPLPMVSIALELQDIPSILVDNYQGMHDAVVHLIEVHGYRRIAFIRGPAGHPEAEDRYRAYRDALAEHALPFNEALVAPGDFREPAGVAAINLLCDQRGLRPARDFEALAVANDVMAIAALKELQARGLYVPDDVAVVGFDDTEESRVVNPPLTTVPLLLYEQGRQATEMLLAKMAGEPVPQRVILPTRTVVRQACGCVPAETLQAAAGPMARSSQTLEAMLATQRGRMLLDITQAIGTVVPEWVEQFVDGFLAELQGEAAHTFLSALDRILRQIIATDGEVNSWQGAVSALRRHVLPCLEGEMRARAEDLWNQARVMIGDTAQRVQVYRGVQAEQQTALLREISQALITTFDIAGLAKVLAYELPRLGIKRGYLSLYEKPEAPAEWARMILAYDEKGAIGLDTDTRRFPARQLVPPSLLPRDRRYTMVVEPLYFRETQLGLAVFEAAPQQEKVSDTVRGHISSALQGTRLVAQVEEHARALRETNEALRRRAVQLETNIEIGRAITSIFDVDQLLRQTVELIRDRFGFYHVGIFLLDETGEWAVLREATGEAGAQMKAQGHRLAVDGTSMVGWTALHREPRIAWDVGKDAVRFAHPLLPRTRSEMTLPLMVGGRVLGVLNVQSEEEAAFDQDDMRTLQSMADQVAIAIENASRLSDEAALLEATSPIYRAARRLITAVSTTEVADAIIASVAETAADGCTVIEFEFSLEGEPRTLLYLGVWRRDRKPQFEPGLRLPILESPVPLDLVGTFWISTDVEQDERLPLSARRMFQDTGVCALVNIPLRARERVIGQVVVLRATPGVFPASALRLYEALSDQASVALERAQLLEEARRRVESERLARQAIDHIRRAVDVEQALQAAAQELAQALEVPHVAIELGV